jgi:hypothetical protein
LRWDVCSFPRRVGRCRRCWAGFFPLLFDLSLTSDAGPSRSRHGWRRGGDRASTDCGVSSVALVSICGAVGLAHRWQHVSLSPACDDGAPGVARSCPRSGWHGAKRRSTQRTTTTIRVSVSDAPRCALPSGPLSAMPAAEPARSRVIVPDGGSGCFLLSRTPTLHRSPLLARTQGWCSPRPGLPLRASCCSPERCQAGEAPPVCSTRLCVNGCAYDCKCSRRLWLRVRHAVFSVCATRSRARALVRRL